MLLQKFPKEFPYCPRFLLKTVTKCSVRNFRNSFYNDCLSARVMHKEQGVEISIPRFFWVV